MPLRLVPLFMLASGCVKNTDEVKDYDRPVGTQ
jgi:hypothetical protein